MGMSLTSIGTSNWLLQLANSSGRLHKMTSSLGTGKRRSELSTCPEVNDDVDHEDSVAKAVEGDPSHA